MTDEKKCPQCAETVKVDAKVCRHCGFNFETGQAAGSTAHPVPPAKKGCGKTALIVGAILLALLVVGMIFAPDPSKTGGDEAAAAGEAAKPALKVSAQELFAAYEANEAAAQQRYGNQPLEVSGTVASVDLDFSDKPVVMLRTSNEFQSAQASLTDASQAKASSLAKGQAVVLLCGGVSEVIGTPMLSDCEFQ